MDAERRVRQGLLDWLAVLKPTALGMVVWLVPAEVPWMWTPVPDAASLWSFLALGGTNALWLGWTYRVP